MKIIYLFLSIYSFGIYAVIPEIIETERPGQSLNSTVVGKNVFQLQSGIEFSDSEVSNQKTENLLNNNVFRYGIADSFELSTVIDANNLNEDTQVGNLRIGGRIKIFDQANGLLPQLIFQTRAQILNSNGDYPGEFKFNSTFSATHDLGKIGALTSNIIISNIGDDSVRFAGYTLSLARNMTNKISLFFELYGSYRQSDWLHSWNTGGGYLFTKNLLFDLSFGSDFKSSITNRFISTGVSWRSF